MIMILTVHIFDLVRAQSLIDGNEFLRNVLLPRSGAWLIDTDKSEHIQEIRRLFTSKNIRFKIRES